MEYEDKRYIIFPCNDRQGVNFAIEVPKCVDPDQMAAKRLVDNGNLSSVMIAYGEYVVYRDERFVKVGKEKWDCDEIVIRDEDCEITPEKEGAV